MERPAPTVREEFTNTRGRLSSLLGCSGLVFLAVFVAVFTLWIVHSTTVWLSLHPEDAFHNAKVIAHAWQPQPTDLTAQSANFNRESRRISREDIGTS